jgi:hypothetical protein
MAGTTTVPRASAKARKAAAIDLLERQACNCLPKIQCLRCELLELLR